MLNPLMRPHKLIKLFCLASTLLLHDAAFAQRRGGPINLPLVDYDRLRFGFSVGVPVSNFKTALSKDFLMIDSLKGVRAVIFPGLYLGASMNVRLGDHFNLRIIPDLSFAQRNMVYTFTKGERTLKVESAYIDVPVLLKFKSVRHRNVLFYAVAGGRYSYDLISNWDAPRSNGRPIVAVVPHSYAYEFGCGLDFYFPWFKVSPEIRVVNGINNLLSADEFVYSKALEGLYSKSIQICIHLE
jgi:hypothetical protein